MTARLQQGAKFPPEGMVPLVIAWVRSENKDGSLHTCSKVHFAMGTSSRHDSAMQVGFGSSHVL